MRMLRLPARFATCSPPIPRAGLKDGDLIPSEESASLWLWAWPRLLGWPRRINWLFSPVTGKTVYPGDLWGLDSRGELLIVETKIARASKTTDPFEDFVPYTSSSRYDEACRASGLRRRWTRLLRSEREFIRERLTELDQDLRPRGTFPGVVPYSSHRDSAWHWRSLFRSRIAPRLLGPQYERAVRRSLDVRAAAGDAPPVFVGLVATIHDGDPRLSGKGLRAFTALQDRVGHDHVLFRAIRPARRSEELRIQSWCPAVTNR